MDLAVNAVQNAGMSINRASKAYNVPYSSLWEKSKGIRRNKLGIHKRKFTEREEAYLADMVLRCADIGIPLNKKMFKRIVPELAAEKGFTGSDRTLLSEKWQRNFLKRHPEISEKLSRTTKTKKSQETGTCDGWLELLSELHMDGYLDDPEGIWNLDETTFKVAESVSLVYAPRGTNNVLSYCDGTDPELVTVVAGGSAAGTILRPLISFDGRVFDDSRSDGTEGRCGSDADQSDVMDNTTFTEYIRHEIIPAMTAEKNVIFLDDHSSHVANYELLVMCATSEKKIKVVRFPPGQTEQLQLKDLKSFGPVKKYWMDFLRKEPPLFHGLASKQDFADMLISKLWNEFDMERNITAGFEAAGIYPFHPEAICKDFVAKEPKPRLAAAVEILSAKQLYAPQLQQLRFFLRAHFLALMESEIDEVVNFTLLKLEGFRPPITAPDPSKGVESHLLRSRPSKRRRETITSLGANNKGIVQ